MCVQLVVGYEQQKYAPFVFWYLFLVITCVNPQSTTQTIFNMEFEHFPENNICLFNFFFFVSSVFLLCNDIYSMICPIFGDKTLVQSEITTKKANNNSYWNSSMVLILKCLSLSFVGCHEIRAFLVFSAMTLPRRSGILFLFFTIMHWPEQINIFILFRLQIDHLIHWDLFVFHTI